jgi:hypothetical protein
MDRIFICMVQNVQGQSRLGSESTYDYVYELIHKPGGSWLFRNLVDPYPGNLAKNI